MNFIVPINDDYRDKPSAGKFLLVDIVFAYQCPYENIFRFYLVDMKRIKNKEYK